VYMARRAVGVLCHQSHGAALHSIMETILLDTWFDLPSVEGVE
jgi:hypothetical protein